MIRDNHVQEAQERDELGRLHRGECKPRRWKSKLARSRTQEAKTLVGVGISFRDTISSHQWCHIFRVRSLLPLATCAPLGDQSNAYTCRPEP
jgi:hypothetical protein